MATNIKTYTISTDVGLRCNDSYKLIQVLSDDVFIFYSKKVTSKHTLQYVRKSENWLVEHQVHNDIGMILDSCISYNEDLIFISYTGGTSGLVLFSTIDASDTITQYATGSNMGTDIDYFVMIPLLTGGGADEVYFIYGQATPTALNYRTFVPSTTTLSAEADIPTTPETGLFWTRFNCTEYDDKVYFASACTQDANINGLCNLYLLAYDRLSDSFFWDLCVFKFDFAVDEGYIRTVITQGIATDGDSLHMQISVVGGSTVDYPSTDAFKIIKRATYIVYKDMLDGEWQKYCRLDDRINDWLGYTVGGTVSRGNFVMLKMRSIISGGAWSLINAYPGANNQNNHYYKNTYKALIDKARSYYYGFNIPSLNTISCYVPTVMIYSDDYVNGVGPTTQKIDYVEMNYAPSPPRPVYLTTGNLWSPTLTPILAANYRGVTKPSKMDVEIYNVAGFKLVDRSETDDNTWFQVLVTDFLAADTLYRWRCRFYDECDYVSAWSAMSDFYIRTAPEITSMTIDNDTQRQTLVFETDEYGKELKSFQLVITKTSDSSVVWTSPVLNATTYKTAAESYYYTIDTHGLILTGIEYRYTLTITNLLGYTDTEYVDETPVFATAANPTNLVTTIVGAYIKVDWTASGAITEYRVYRSLDGATYTFLEDVTAVTYNDLAVPMNKTVTYKICSKDTVSQSTGLTGTKKITWLGYGYVYEDSLFSGLTGAGVELVNNLSNNVEDFGYDVSSKYETVNGNVSLYFTSLTDLAKVETYREENIYIKVFEEVYFYKIREVSIDRTQRKYGYLVTYSLFSRELL